MIILLITILLLTINILFINFSKNKLRYSIFSSRLFLVFIGLYLLSSFLTFSTENSKNAISVYDVKSSNPSKPISISNEKESENRLKASKIESKKKEQNSTYIQQKIFETAIIQVGITIILSFIGYLIIRKKTVYYRNMLLVHIPVLILCLLYFFYFQQA